MEVMEAFESLPVLVFIVPLVVFAAISLALAKLISVERLRHKSPQREPELTLDAKDLLHDLMTRGQAIVRVEVIDPTNLLLRSPRR